MLDDEIGRRANKALARRLQRARFDQEQTLSDFDVAFNPTIPSAQVRDLASCGFIGVCRDRTWEASVARG